MTRGDIHSPSNVRPERYTWLDSLDLSDTVSDDEYYASIVVRLIEGSPHDREDQCAHCGAYLRYVAVMEYRDGSNRYLVPWGHDCLDTLSMLEDNAAAKLRQLKLARQRREQAKRNQEERERFKQDQPDVYTLLQMAVAEPQDHLDFVLDVAWRFQRDPYLSERQVAALERCVKGHEKFVLGKLEREERERVRLQTVTPIPEHLLKTRFTETYRVVSTDVRDSDYGIRYCMLVEHPDGWRLWGTAPDSVFSDIRDDMDRPRKHTHVRFACRIDPSEDDPTFGYISRPTKAKAFTPEPEPEVAEQSSGDTPF